MERYVSPGEYVNNQPLLRVAQIDPLLVEVIHALALHTLTPEEWFAKGGTAPTSPPCLKW